MRDRIIESFHRLARQGTATGIGYSSGYHNRQFFATIIYILLYRKKGSLTVQCIKNSFYQQQVRTAIYQATALIAQKGYPITLVTPGLNPTEILRCVRELGPQFEQVVLAGYPPFVKDVLDAGRAAGLDWTPFHIKMIFAGESIADQ